MNARLLVLPVVVASIVAANGCKKSENKAGGGTGAAAAPACSDKALKHTNPGFCVDLPAGYEASAEKKTVTQSMEITVTRKSDNEGFVIGWGRPNMTFEESVKSDKKPQEGEKIVEQGDMPGGGYFVKTVSNDDTTDHKDFFTIYSTAKGSKGFVTCFGMNAKKDFIADVLATCKAIRVD